MIKKSYDSLKYTRYSEYNVINVWTTNEKREAIIKRKLITDKNFKLTSLQVNPLYKPIFDKIDALAVKELNQLDKSILWSRHYTKQTFKYSFVYPLIAFGIAIFFIISYGVRYRLYANYIKYGRELELASMMDIDLEDITSYPKAVMELYLEKKKYDAYTKKKENKIKSVEENFHKFVEKRIMDTAEMRKKRGLRVRESIESLQRYNDGDHMMKSLDDLIAEDKGRLKKRTDQLRGKESRNQGFQKKGIHKQNRSFDRKKGFKTYNQTQQTGYNSGSFGGGHSHGDRNHSRHGGHQSREENFNNPWNVGKKVGGGGAGGFSGLASGGTTLKVKNLHYEVTEDQLEKDFGKFGRLHSSKILWDKQDRSTGEALVVFENPKAAEEAIKALNRSVYEGQTIQVAKA